MRIGCRTSPNEFKADNSKIDDLDSAFARDKPGEPAGLAPAGRWLLAANATKDTKLISEERKRLLEDLKATDRLTFRLHKGGLAVLALYGETPGLPTFTLDFPAK